MSQCVFCSTVSSMLFSPFFFFLFFCCCPRFKITFPFDFLSDDLVLAVQRKTRAVICVSEDLADLFLTKEPEGRIFPTDPLTDGVSDFESKPGFDGDPFLQPSPRSGRAELWELWLTWVFCLPKPDGAGEPAQGNFITTFYKIKGHEGDMGSSRLPYLLCFTFEHCKILFAPPPLFAAYFRPSLNVGRLVKQQDFIEYKTHTHKTLGRAPLTLQPRFTARDERALLSVRAKADDTSGLFVRTALGPTQHQHKALIHCVISPIRSEGARFFGFIILLRLIYY